MNKSQELEIINKIQSLGFDVMNIGGQERRLNVFLNRNTKKRLYYDFIKNEIFEIYGSENDVCRLVYSSFEEAILWIDMKIQPEKVISFSKQIKSINILFNDFNSI